MEVIKINDTTYRIVSKHQPLRIVVPKIASPFGPEDFCNVTYLNLEVDSSKSNHTNLWGDLYKIENFFIDYVKKIDSNIQWCSSIKTKDHYKPLWKVRFEKRRNGCAVDTCVAGKLCTWKEILDCTNNLKNDVGIEVWLKSLWIKDGKAGLLWVVKKITA